jgi:hypothetical protein
MEARARRRRTANLRWSVYGVLPLLLYFPLCFSSSLLLVPVARFFVSFFRLSLLPPSP